MFPVTGPPGPIPGIATPPGAGRKPFRGLERVDGPPHRRSSNVQLRGITNQGFGCPVRNRTGGSAP